METTESTRTVQTPRSRRGSVIGGLLPFIGVILFIGATILQFAGGVEDDGGPTFLANAIVYLIGWAGVGAGISHIFFGRRISQTIGFDKSPYELEVGFADLAMGIVALLASGYGPDFALAVILSNAIFRIGCGIGHIRAMIRDRNFAINNTAILFIDFAVPAFLVATYYSVWA
ncbi:DUF6790 family protein [Microbacterium sp.]|jgi:hypothetical protein|uniref:DUF6790 family protein n=1 Tax=Microbacterium sp. TaxID=51671 RepID=UPI0037C8D2C5